ncbi:hypothetical protein jhhlp_002271 [Lomentospora prolificans]|uniref:Autophagy-related protein 11 n=1 Tax=Lomentospora prolificans TaxID=41688 RepID=A0A2N3NDL5_9PEZI|nr:hypothetical protein jhhlp_002271 [Lomentospora prolificans]
MASEVFIAHTGQRFQVDTTQFTSYAVSSRIPEILGSPWRLTDDFSPRLDELKAWVARQSSIPFQKIIALTPEGRSLKLQGLHTEASGTYFPVPPTVSPTNKEIYIYDIRITQPTANNAAPLKSEYPIPKRYVVPAAPNSIDDIKAMSAWQELYRDRRAWALDVSRECSQMDLTIQERYREIDAMVRCLDAAVANLEFSIKQIEPKYAELKKWMEPALLEHEQLASNWENYLALARAIPIAPQMVKFMTSKDVKPSRACLEDLIDLDTARKAGRLAPTSLRKFSGKATELDKVVSQMYHLLQNLVEEFDKLVGQSALLHGGESAQLQQDIEALAKKIDSDYQHILNYTSSQRDVLQASKTASTHTERLIPSLKKRAKEMDDLLQYATKARNNIAADCVGFMRSITEVTSLHATVKSQIVVLNQAEEDMTTFDYLRLIHQLPYMYASFVVEAIRRREWSEKVKSDSSTLANTMAVFQDEESKRRRKWQKTVGSTYGRDKFDANTLGLEVNLLGEDDPWPSMTKQDMEVFIESLTLQKAEPAIIDDVTKLLSDLNTPTKQQSKRIKAFKNGSVHDAALGISGLLVRGDDDLIRSLQDDKAKLESKVKTAESRIRRLEDLLHRQSQASRPSLGNVFQAQSSDSTSSIKPITKASDGAEALLSRISALEADLNVEKQRAIATQKELTAQNTLNSSMRRQIEEANSTKKDLLENLEALKIEFVEERKSLESEIKRLQARLEDTEDEIEHFGESREHEKASFDETLQKLRDEIARLQREKKSADLKSQGEIDFLKDDSRAHRDHSETLEKQIRSLQEELKGTTTAYEESIISSESHLRLLQDLFRLVSPQEAVPTVADELINATTATVSGIMVATKNANDRIVSLEFELAQNQNTMDNYRRKADELSSRLDVEMSNSSKLRAALKEEKIRNEGSENELAEARQQLAALRVQLTDGETGSESLRKALEAQEQKTTTLHEELASKQAEIGRLEDELRLFRERLRELQAKLLSLTHRVDAKAERAKDLTQRIYSQNDRLCRLLEKLGFAVTREGSSMTVQKIPRAERALHMQNTTDLSDLTSPTARRSTTLAGNVSPSGSELELLYWMNSNDEETEAERYQAFMRSLGAFDIDLFSETLFRRVKDMEHLARKFQRESRAYREKALIFQREAHEKIAYKNFKEGDLALFLPTRNQSSGAWACFNVGFPHYFLREQDSHGLRNREWLVARISKIQERVVDLSKSVQAHGDTDSMTDEGNDNPFQLSDGLRWYLLDAHEDKHGAPSTPGLGKSTVAANKVEAVADMRARSGTEGKDKQRLSQQSIEGVSKTLSKSLESRRGSTSSRKTLPFAISGGGLLKNTPLASETNSLRAAASETASAKSPPGVGPQGGLDYLETTGRAAPRNGDVGNDKSAEQAEAPEAITPRLSRELSSTSIVSPSKRSVVFESLWNLDLNYESPSKK